MSAKVIAYNSITYVCVPQKNNKQRCNDVWSASLFSNSEWNECFVYCLSRFILKCFLFSITITAFHSAYFEIFLKLVYESWENLLQHNFKQLSDFWCNAVQFILYPICTYQQQHSFKSSSVYFIGIICSILWLIWCCWNESGSVFKIEPQNKKKRKWNGNKVIRKELH